ncbi:MAG: nodulation protein NfeD [Ignavibacteria bacterium]|nr:nodulation protein NfeD [Ignavibacteria bacterium]
MKLLIKNILILTFLVQVSIAQPSKVFVLKIDDPITPPISEYIHDGIEAAIESNAECVVIKLNTPGGLLKSTRVIVSEILEAKIPVVVYVTPSGAQAASAGVFITLSGHIAAMTPGTNIGAAHPVSLEKTDTVMIEKATNDAAAFIRTISEKRNRNVKWAEDAVRKSLSITETEALKLKVIDLIASDLTDLLKKIDSMKVIGNFGEKILSTKNAQVIEFEMSIGQKLLRLISDPNIAYILLMIGLYGLLFELYNPGSIFPGVIGIISLILAFYALHTLPVNLAGIALIIVAIILFVLETQIVSHGLLTIGGLISFILGSLMLIKTESALEVFKVSYQVIIVLAILTFLFFSFAIGLGLKAQKRRTTTGLEGMIGEIGETITDLNPEGQIRVHGEIWNAVSIDNQKINEGTKVEVIDYENLKLKVKKI